MTSIDERDVGDVDAIDRDLHATGDFATDPTLDRRPGRRVRFGRFEVDSQVGEGAMGTVYAAHDPMLDRRVAVKVLDRVGGENSERLRREAHAMARLSHPNVVQVYDVDQQDGAVWVAMEFVDGQTLDVWQAEPGRTWREVARMYARVGAGLRAAHDAGLLHRDFKPQNVIVGSDGRPRVIDFGLARPSAALTAVAQGPAAPGGLDGGRLDETRPDPWPSSPLDTELTAEGAMVGTPAYMSPEQMQGQALGPASDQFSFCVSLYEALYGQPPFDRRNVRTLFSSVIEGRSKPPPAESGVPAWLGEAVLRGLAVDPAERWPSMESLLDVLTDGVEDIDLTLGGRSRRIWLWLLVIVAVVEGVHAVSVGALPPLDDLVWQGMAWMGVGAAFWVWLRRIGAETPFNRPIAAWLTITPIAFVVNRAVCWQAGVDVEVAVTVDLAVFGTTSLLIAAVALPWAAWVGVAMFASGAALYFGPPGYAAMLSGLGVGVGVFLIGFFVRRDLKRQQVGRPDERLKERPSTGRSRSTLSIRRRPGEHARSREGARSPSTADRDA